MLEKAWKQMQKHQKNIAKFLPCELGNLCVGSLWWELNVMMAAEPLFQLTEIEIDNRKH